MTTHTHFHYISDLCFASVVSEDAVVIQAEVSGSLQMEYLTGFIT